MVMNKESTKLLIQQLTDGISEIMKKSYSLCEHDDVEVSKLCSQINNSAFVLKQKAELLKKEISITD